ncbi:MAG: PKD domain-containing protein [bacterium]
MNKCHCMRTAIGTAVAVVIMLASSVLGADASIVGDFTGSTSKTPPVTSLKMDPSDYTGWIRLYVMEIESHWDDDAGQPFHYGFLGFAVDSYIVMSDGSRYAGNLVWNCNDAGWWSSDDRDNIFVIAVLSNDDPHQAYSDPPTGNPFWAYYVDATAGAGPGEVDSNHTTGNSTHTVFVIDHSTTWCPNCPTTSYYLNSVYNSGNYNFFFTTMVSDRNPKADVWLDSLYNSKYIPTCYNDGGYDVLIGGVSPHTPYQNMVNYCAARAVEDVGVILHVEWPDTAVCDMYIDFAMAHGTPVNTEPATPLAPTGPDPILRDTTGEYVVLGTDPENDQLFYRWDWGDGDTSIWSDRIDDGIACTLSHSWAANGDYDVRVQVKDPFEEAGGWSAPMTVSVFCCLLRGDVDATGATDVGDLTSLVAYLFQGGAAPPCEDEGDVDGSGATDVGDLTSLVAYLFQGGASPPACP